MMLQWVRHSKWFMMLQEEKQLIRSMRLQWVRYLNRWIVLQWLIHTGCAMRLQRVNYSSCSIMLQWVRNLSRSKMLQNVVPDQQHHYVDIQIEHTCDYNTQITNQKQHFV